MPSLAAHVQESPIEYITTMRNRALEMEERGERIIRLESGDTEAGVPRAIRLEIERALENGETRYANQVGIPSLRERIREEIKRDRGVDLSLGEICVTNGGTGALFTAFFGALNNGDEVILPAPYWPVVFNQIKHVGGVPVEVPVAPDFDLDPESIRAAITDRTKLIYVNSPNNPTGATFSIGSLERVAEIANEHDLWIVTDETYKTIVFDGEHKSLFSLSGMAERTILTDSFSKEYLCTGLRVGYAATKHPGMSKTFKDIARSLTSGISTPTQYAFARAEIDEDVRAGITSKLKEKRDTLVAGLRGIRGIDFAAPKAAFYLFIDMSAHIPTESKDDPLYIARLLLQDGVAVCPGRAFGSAFNSYIRLAYSTPTIPELQDACVRIRNRFGASE